MAWTTPMTFVDGTALTAAQLNTYLRDNLNETATAKATTPGGMCFGTDANEFVERVPDLRRIEGVGYATGTSYVDSTDPFGPTVTLDTGTTAFVFLSAQIGNITANAASYMSYGVTGATTISADDAWGMSVDGIAESSSSNYLGLASMNMVTDLTPGENTFTAKYRVGSGTGVFFNRCIAVWPLG